MGGDGLPDVGPRKLVVVPAYNEEEALPAVLATLSEAVPDHDVLVVDDGSADRTADVARAGGARVAQLPFNVGIGGALRTGFRYAVRHGYDRVVQFDADGQHDAGSITRLHEALDRGADMVIGSRFAEEEEEEEEADAYEVSHVRGGAMGFLRLVILLLSGRRFSDTSSGFRAFGPRALAFFAEHYPAEYMDSVEALVLAAYAGLDIEEVPTPMRHRVAGVPSNRSLRLVYHYLRVLLVLALSASIRRRPGPPPP